MAGYLTPIDIANRALQHCGAAQIDPTQGFLEQSANAFEIATCYDKLRMAELQANTWMIAIRDAVLRPIDSNTMLLQPTLWTSVATYFQGSIVADANNTLWQSKIPDNLGNNPLLSGTWEQYFGPMTVSLYDSTTSYFDGELVYITAGDGTFKVYRSLVNTNVVDPSLPNQWSPATRYAQDDVVQQFPPWSASTTYSIGQGIAFTDGNVYASLVNLNLNRNPLLTTGSWALVPSLVLQTQPVPATGPITPLQSSPLIEWSPTTLYQVGNSVMFNAVMYLATAVSQGLYPNAPGSVTAWTAITGGTIYQSLINFNTNNLPSASPPQWSATTVYALNAQVGAQDGQIYTSQIASNTGNNPVISPTAWLATGVLTPWTTSFVLGGGNSLWLLVGDTVLFPYGVNLVPLKFMYPIALGPLTQTRPRSVFRLPASFLRTAPRDPKAGQASYIGAPGNLPYDDWVFEGEYFRSGVESGPIFFRFIADMTDVTLMQPLLCETIAARIGYEVCTRLTQSEEKTKNIIGIYEEHIKTAKRTDAILQGATQQPLDDYIATRF